MSDDQKYSYPLADDHIELMPCTEELLEAAIDSDSRLQEVTGYKVDAGWNAFGTEPFQYVLAELKKNPDLLGWYNYLILDRSELLVVGNCGFKGKPDDEGNVELGYEVGSAFRGRGIARRACRLLVKEALSRAPVTTVIAHTLPEVNASVSVLRNCCFEYKGEISLPEGSKIWRWKTNSRLQEGCGNKP